MTGATGSAASAWSGVRNLGPVSVRRLADVGIPTPDALWAVGPAAAYVRLRAAHPGRVSLTMLWALAGAELDVDWRLVPDARKRELEAEVARLS